ncbi:YqhA family protein [Tenacibaculum tangerinum]|uniref:YqhA family protein n=1 Tax=Tenacibaculum tangerinum TaxID=3038772 RepID=A0ABY8L5W4_9FLAO|nr:YqhA family protein [Tenacibaculum tangerinum]WGH76796.1 YqhA family protein [Tenacibaculum tangerinum]
MKSILKILITIIVFFTFINALIFIVMGIMNIYKGISGLFNASQEVSYAALKILDSLDLFLVALVFIVFSSGIYNIFFPQNNNNAASTEKKHILHINSFSQLKVLLWQTILTTLVIHFVASIIHAHGKIDWYFLILPISILLLTVSLGLFQFKGNNKKGDGH